MALLKRGKNRTDNIGWFGSFYYHILYKNRDNNEAKRFLDNLMIFLEGNESGAFLKHGSKILDMACGRGRHAIYLAEKGFKVSGIDISSENVEYARKHWHLHNIDKEKSLEFFIHDLRKVFKEEYFDAVFNLFTSFGYFESEKDDMRVLTAVNRQLKKNGIFVLDYMNVKKSIASLVKHEEKKVDDIHFDINRSVEKKFIVKKIIVKDNQEQVRFIEKVKILLLNDMKRFLQQNGFEIIRIFGDYELSNFDELKSERLILLTVKR